MKNILLHFFFHIKYKKEMSNVVYFLIKYLKHGFVAYAQGVDIRDIQDFHSVKIVRYYPGPITDLSPLLTTFQHVWRLRRLYRRWMSHPNRQLYCAMLGRYPPVPPRFYRLHSR